MEARQIEEAIRLSMLEHTAASSQPPAPPASDALPPAPRTPPRPALQLEGRLSGDGWRLSGDGDDDGDDGGDLFESSGLAWSPGAFDAAMREFEDADDEEAEEGGGGALSTDAAGTAHPVSTIGTLVVAELPPKEHVV